MECFVARHLFSSMHRFHVPKMHQHLFACGCLLKPLQCLINLLNKTEHYFFKLQLCLRRVFMDKKHCDLHICVEMDMEAKLHPLCPIHLPFECVH